MILLEADPSPVYALRFSPDGARLAAGTRNGGLTFFENYAPQGESPPALMTPVNAIDFSPSGGALATGTGIGWFARTLEGKPVHPRTPSRSVTGVKFVGESLLAVGIGDRSRAGAGQIELWDVETKKARTPVLPSPEGVRALDANVTRKRLAWAEWGRRAAVWDIESSNYDAIPLTGAPTAIALDTSANRVGIAVKWEVAVYDCANRRVQFGLKGHKGTLAALLFTPDDRNVVTGSWDGTVKFWDAHTGVETASYDFGVGRVTSLALSPDGLQLAAGGEAGQICVFDVT